jgi:hypothetical protein
MLGRKKTGGLRMHTLGWFMCVFYDILIKRRVLKCLLGLAGVFSLDFESIQKADCVGENFILLFLFIYEGYVVHILGQQTSLN